MTDERFVIHNLISLKNRTRSLSDHESIDYAIKCMKELEAYKNAHEEIRKEVMKCIKIIENCLEEVEE